MLFLWITSRKKLHRFAQAVFFIHYVSHLIRDEVAAAEAVSQLILQRDCECFCELLFILTARRARCTFTKSRKAVMLL